MELGETEKRSLKKRTNELTSGRIWLFVPGFREKTKAGRFHYEAVLQLEIDRLS